MKKLLTTLRPLENTPSLPGKWILFILMACYIPHLYLSYTWYLQTTMPDLYMRIIGSRLFSHGLNPYYYIWMPGDPFLFFNPNYFEPSGLNGVTVTPFVLWLQIPLSKLNFCDAKFAWWTIMEGSLFATLFFSLLIPKNLLRQVVVVAVFLCFFLFSRNWWLHIYNGQYYVLFALVFSFTGYLMVKKPRSLFPFWFYPIVSLIRPFFIVSLIPWLIRKLPKKIKFVCLGSIIAIFLLLIVGNLEDWQQYQSAMKAYGGDIPEQPATGQNKDPRKLNIPLEACVTTVDHFPKTQAGCLFELQHYLRISGLPINSLWPFSILLLLTVGFFMFLTMKRADIENPEIIFLASFLFYILCEIFTPASRNPYNMIQYAGILGVLVNKGSYKIIIVAILGLALNHDFPFRFIYQREIGELLLLAAISFTILKKRKLLAD